MNIKQLRDYLDSLLVAGFDSKTPVCIAADGEAFEVDDASIITGPFREDPAPHMCGFRPRKGQFLFLETCDDYEWLKGTGLHTIEQGPEVPFK